MPVGRGRIPGARYPGRRVSPFEDWVSLVVTQLLAPRQLLFTRSGQLFGFWIGWHVYTADGCYVGSFRDAIEHGEAAELYSARGEYLGERDPQERDRLAIDLSKRRRRRLPEPELPPLPPPATLLYALREPLSPRAGWQDFPAAPAFATSESPDSGDPIHPHPPFRAGGRTGITWS